MEVFVMISNRNKLLWGVALGTLGVACYKAYRHYKEESEFIKKATSNHSTNYTTRTMEHQIDDSIIDYID
jgi:hypothetical protein